VKKKKQTEAERRAAAEQAAAYKRAEEMKARENAEHVAIEAAKNYYDNCWADFAKDSKKSKSLAYNNLKDNLAEGASFLVPILMTAKEHMAMIADADSHIKGDTGQVQEDPRSLMAQWIRGEIELSRIPLEKAAVLVAHE
jgi:hypothetical protein